MFVSLNFITGTQSLLLNTYWFKNSSHKTVFMGIQIIDPKELLESLIVLVINFKMIIKRYKKSGIQHG